MKSIREYVQEREMRRTGGTPERAAFHSKGYHRYFEGYSEFREEGKDGKTRIRRVYTGVYHTQRLGNRAWIGIRIAYVLLLLVSFAGYFYLISRPFESNHVWYVAAAEALSVLGLFWLIWNLFNFLTAGKRMTLGEFRYVEAVSRASAFTAAMQFLTACMTVLHALAEAQNRGEEFACAAGLLTCALCLFAIWGIEQRITYDSSLSTEEVPRDANQITSD